MKTLTEIIVDGIPQNAIIRSWLRAIRDGDNEIIWVDKANNIAKHQQLPDIVEIYIKDPADSKKVMYIEISSGSIKKLYALIVEIEKQISEEFFD